MNALAWHGKGDVPIDSVKDPEIVAYGPRARDKFPFGAAMNKGLTIKTGQTHVQRYTQLLLDERSRPARSTRRAD